MGETVKGAIIGAVATLLAALIAAFVAYTNKDSISKYFENIITVDEDEVEI